MSQGEELPDLTGREALAVGAAVAGVVVLLALANWVGLVSADTATFATVLASVGGLSAFAQALVALQKWDSARQKRDSHHAHARRVRSESPPSRVRRPEMQPRGDDFEPLGVPWMAPHPAVVAALHWESVALQGRNRLAGWVALVFVYVVALVSLI